MRVRAYAKINVGLRVLGKRQDGYHDIETIFHRIDCYDTISISRSLGLSFASDSREIPTDHSNLCLRAAEKLRERCHARDGVSIVLEKRIPVGAGLGGGSSDAAAVLQGLNSLWNLKLEMATLREIALELGSDVPYFLETGAAYAMGRGESLEAMNFALPYWILVVTPPIRISTAWAYANLEPGHLSAAASRMLLEKSLQTGLGVQEHMVNDFETLVFQHYPVVRDLKETMYKHGSILALLSGSGSSVFGLFRSQTDAERARAQFDPSNHSSLTEPHFRVVQGSERD